MPSSASSNITVILTPKIFLGVLSSTLKVVNDVLQHNKFPASQKHKKLQTKKNQILQKHFRSEAPVSET